MPKKGKRLKETVGRALIKAGKVCIFVPFLPGTTMIVAGMAMLPPSKRKKIKILPPIVGKVARRSLNKARSLMTMA